VNFEGKWLMNNDSIMRDETIEVIMTFHYLSFDAKE
jgi:hypothetical protein